MQVTRAPELLIILHGHLINDIELWLLALILSLLSEILSPYP